MANFTNFEQSRHQFLPVFEGDKVLTGGDTVVAVHNREEAHGLIRSLLKENMNCATEGTIGGLAYWSDYHYYVRIEERYFLIDRGY